MNRDAENHNNILILPKSGGREDIYASFKNNTNKNSIYELPRAEIKNIYNFFVKSKNVKNYRYYHSDKTIIDEKERYFDYLKKLSYISKILQNKFDYKF